MDGTKPPRVDPLSTGQPPSLRRRVAAALALVAGLLLVVMLVLFLLENPLFLVVGLVGVAVAVAGAWWLATEPMPRRGIGIAGVILGLLVIGVALLRVVVTAEQLVLRGAVLLLLLVVATGATRMALVHDLHELDRAKALRRVRPTKPVLLCNPWSGGGKVDSYGLPALAAELGVEVIRLDHGLDLERLAREAVARGADCLGMAGGDGSQALVAAIATEHGIPFVCISAGTRNHFALDLGLDRDDPRAGMVAFRDGVERWVDYATVNDRVFVNNVSLGIYATIVSQDGYRDAKLDTSKQLLPELLGRRAEPFDLQFTTPDDRPVDGAFLILVSNNPYVLGPSLGIGQRRSVASGQLGVVALDARTGQEAAALVARSSVGLGRRDPHIHEFSTERFEVRSRSGRAFAGVDGESLDMSTPLEFRIHPRGLRLLVPEQSLGPAQRRRARGLKAGALVAVAAGRPPRLG